MRDNGGQIREAILFSLAIQLTAAATILGALFFEHVVGLTPCPLCLVQRHPYYVLLLLGPILVLTIRKAPAHFPIIAFFPVIAIMGFSAYLGGYHAGTEWGFWPGPTTCAAPAALPTNPADLLRQVQASKPIADCTVAAWRFAGISLAGWNALISAGIMLLAVGGLISSSRKAV